MTFLVGSKVIGKIAANKDREAIILSITGQGRGTRYNLQYSNGEIAAVSSRSIKLLDDRPQYATQHVIEHREPDDDNGSTSNRSSRSSTSSSYSQSQSQVILYMIYHQYK